MAEVNRLVTADLMVEDRLNEEVKELLRAHTAEIEWGNIDYADVYDGEKATGQGTRSHSVKSRA